jgi:4,5-DOPA dioxygenase extradiol
MKLTPLIYVDHWSPMRIIEDNPMNEKLETLWNELKSSIKSILIISAHWLTDWNYITSGVRMKTIYDFYWFPSELYDIKYEPKIDEKLWDNISDILWSVTKTTDWWLDHWAWSVLKKLFPEADIPVIQLSINKKIWLNDYFEIWKKISKLREEWVLIIWSGSIVHNLSDFDFEKDIVYNWAFDFDNYIKDSLLKGDFEGVIEYMKIPNSRKSVYTFDHYVPLLYILWASRIWEKVNYLNWGITNWSLSNNLIVIK